GARHTRGGSQMRVGGPGGDGALMTRAGAGMEPQRTLGLELARSDLKAGRSWGSRSPFRVLADHHRAGRPADWRLYEEWLLVSKGHRTLEGSRGLRAQPLPELGERTEEGTAAGS